MAGNPTRLDRSRRLNVKCFLTLLPVARAELVGLERVKHSKNFIYVASHAEIIYRHVANDVIGIDDEGRALADAFVRVEDAKLVSEFPLHVGKHRERQILQIRVMLP